jgi:eukaryotic-like serine/threonine-protein kinase
MIATASTSRGDSTTSPGDDRGLVEANRVASAIKDRWQRGEPPDVRNVLAKHPELRHHRSVLLDLAYNEYRLRLQAGEEVDAETFSRRFPSLQRSLHLLIEVQGLLSRDPDLQALQGILPWPEPGSHFLQFDLIAEIGRGTFGRVFLAGQPSLGNRQVVVKVAPHGGEEAEILGRLRHPNIVPIYSLQEDDATGLAAFCMPYLGRATLCDVLDHALVDSRLPNRAQAILDAVGVVNSDFDLRESQRPDTILRKGSYVDGVVHLGIQLADALAHSHGRGIYHRDLKPSNVLMTSEGRPLLLDFNLSVDGRLLTGRVGGTVPYMAPEELTVLFERPKVARQRHYDPRSDLFSLGVILYELLTGTLPFGAIPWSPSLEELAFHLYQRQAKGPNPMREHNSQVDSRLARLIESCLAMEPEGRPETAHEVATALRRELTPVRRSVRWMGNHRKLVVGTAATLLALTLTVILFFALRPPYSVRQLQHGLAYIEQGRNAEAVVYLNNSILAAPDSVEALFARGRAYQRLGEFQTAFQDYHLAYQMVHSPVLNACKGYCLSRMKSHKAAIGLYLSALEAGYDSPALLHNNMGFSYLMLGQIDNAEKHLQHAIRLDGNLQAAHYNMVMISLQRAIQGHPIPNTAFVHAARAIEIGPPTADLYHGIAALYATAAKQDPTLIRPAIEHVRRAVELGFKPEAFTSDIRYSSLRKDPTFHDVLKEPVLAPKSQKVVQLVDPLDKR